MSKPLRTVAMVAGVVALTFAIPGVGTAIGSAIGVSITAGTAATVAAVASAVSVAAGTAAQAIQKPPDMRGTVSQVMIGANMAVPYAMGRTYIGGNQVYDKSSDGTDLDERTQIFVGSVAGPIDSFEALQADYTTITFSGTSGGLISGEASGFYDNFLWANSRKGARPETAMAAVTGMTGALAEWGSSHKLSGMASWFVSMEFDEDGERWASGIPQWGMIGKWVKVYDPRKDSTYPGGSGSHRWDDEGTWEFGTGGSGDVAPGENPGLHAIAYARGRFVNGVKVVGVGLAQEAIDVAAFVELANVCDANGWVLGGAVYEGPGISKWDNLKRILQAGGAEPVWIGGMLTCRINAPKTSLDTVTADDLADSGIEVTVMKGWRDRHNTIVPRFRSEDHKWEYIQADAVVYSTGVTEDGEEKTKETQLDLVQDKDQAAQLVAYELRNGREFGPIAMAVKPRLMLYRLGEALTLDIPEAGLDEVLAVITSRTVDPANGSIQLTFESETTAKHAYALGQAGGVPPTPTTVDPADLDSGSAAAQLTTAQLTALIEGSTVSGLTFSVADTGAVTISNHSRVYSDKTVSVTGTGGGSHATSASAGDTVYIYYDQQSRAGGAVTYQHLVLAGGTGDASPAFASSANPYRHFVCHGVVQTAGNTTSGGSNAGSGGGTSVPYCVTTDTLILMADGSERPAGEIHVGDKIHTMREHTLEWGDYSVEATQVVPDQPLYRVEIAGRELRATGDHRIHLDGGWVRLREIGTPDGQGDVVKMSVADAHTYVSNGLLSHNAKVTPPPGGP